MKSEVTTVPNLQPRMPNPAVAIPDALKPLMELGAVIKNSTALPARIVDLVHLRVSQINGCSVCVDMHGRELRRTGEIDDRVFTVAAWRDAPYFSDQERAALALAESVTRLADLPDPVPDDIWNEATRHFDEPALAMLVLSIGVINFWNRINVPTRQVAGAWKG